VDHWLESQGWKTASKAPVKNVDLWQELDAAQLTHQIEWRWVRGHTGHPGNERADQLANRGVDLVLSGRAWGISPSNILCAVLTLVLVGAGLCLASPHGI
jgi:hypothetical protein